jgi:YD repeat-containing protein
MSTGVGVAYGAGTGINPWWRYQEQSVPGAGHVMVNVGTGNYIVDVDDMSVPHKGIALAFRRTYNSQSGHDIVGTDGSLPSLYGNGWTSTWDAHLSGDGVHTVTVWDIDGGRYDYTVASDGVTWQAPAGQHALLTSNGGCGFLWTKKSGTTYEFYSPAQVASCSGIWSQYAGFAGRLHQIVGRNRNTSLTFSYVWDNGDTSAGGKIANITAIPESGLQSTMVMADFNGHRLAYDLNRPDGTVIYYGYDNDSNLASVGKPPNNPGSAQVYETYGYAQQGNGARYMSWAATPRWVSSSATDGSYLYFGAEARGNTTLLRGIGHVGVVNPQISDGSSSTAVLLQSNVSAGVQQYLTEYYILETANPTFSDTNGHMASWIVDAAGRPLQTQECTVSVNQGQQCTGSWLTTHEAWDASNDLVAEADARGNETDYAYDANGNTIAVAEPQTTSSQGTFRPTRLLDYDGLNNVTAFCDQTQTHAARADWGVPPTPAENLCSTKAAAIPHWSATYTYPSVEPYGELATMVTPLGYTHHFAYSPSMQGGVDSGQPTSVTGDAYSQIDGSSVTPAQTFWYDGSGQVRCYGNGSGTYVLSYDALGRLLSVADPDDTSVNGTSFCGKGSGKPGWNTRTTYSYFPGGAIQSSQSPAQHSGNVSTTFTYDADGDEITEVHHFGCIAGSTCAPGTTTKWYDGADRLVETAMPSDPTDYYSSRWLTRYLYDLSQAGSVSIAGTSYHAFGNLYKTQEWVPAAGASAPSWVDLRGSAYDALDRTTSKYTFSPSADTTVSATTLAYDANPGTLGLLSSQTDPLGESATYTYDSAGRQTNVSFTGDGGVTPARSFTYDPNGRQASATGSSYGTTLLAYDTDGRQREVDEPTGGSITSPARLVYDYYPDGRKKALNVTSAALSASPLITYAYRADGKRTAANFLYGGLSKPFTTNYSDGGRPSSQTDPYTGISMPAPTAPVNAGTRYAPTTWSYATDGQLNGVGLPQALAYAVSHDDEGHVAAWNTGPISSAVNAAVQFVNTSRGENVQQIMKPTTGVWSAHSANGAMVPSAISSGARPPLTKRISTVEPINALTTGSTLYTYGYDPEGVPYACAPIASVDAYDSASRLIGRTVRSVNDTQCSVDENTFTNSYDADNHTVSQDSNTATWGALGKPYIVTNGSEQDCLHYDGDMLLFATNGQGALLNVKMETLGDIDKSGQFTAWDRDFSGARTSGHNNSIYYGVTFGSAMWPALKGQSTNPSSPVYFSGSTNAPSCIGACGLPSFLPYNRLEGFQWGALTIQGARVVDSATGQWTTPDAYDGDVHDPMSQKPFMWDRNNPYEYNDPSGYCVEDLCIGESIALGIALRTAAPYVFGALAAAGGAIVGALHAEHASGSSKPESSDREKHSSGDSNPSSWGTKDDPRVKGMIENPSRPGSWGVNDENGKFGERIRFDWGKAGARGNRGKDHEHHNGGKNHLPPGTPYQPPTRGQ